MKISLTFFPLLWRFRHLVICCLNLCKLRHSFEKHVIHLDISCWRANSALWSVDMILILSLSQGSNSNTIVSLKSLMKLETDTRKYSKGYLKQADVGSFKNRWSVYSAEVASMSWKTRVKASLELFREDTSDSRRRIIASNVEKEIQNFSWYALKYYLYSFLVNYLRWISSNWEDPFHDNA